MAGSVAGLFMERKSRVPIFLLLVFSSGHASPGRRGLRSFRVAAGKQHLEFVGFQNLRCLRRALRPETKPAGRQALLAKPKSPGVIDEYFYGRPSAISKNEQTAGKSIGLQRLLADAHQTVNSISKIDRLHRHQDAHLGNDLNHDAALQTLSLRTARSAPPRPGPRISTDRPGAFS